jgi:ABC-type amino acid transport substrate-binding protein
MRIWLLMCLLWQVACIHAQAPQPTPKQVLRIGTTAHYPPFASIADQKNDFVGFEIDIMGQICKRINASCQYKAMTVEALAPALMMEQIDLAMAAIIIPSVKIEPFIFSLPYLPSSAQFMTEKQSSINVPADIRNKKVGVRSGTLYNNSLLGSLVKQIYQDEVTIVMYPKMDDMFVALTNHEIDVIFTNTEAVKYWNFNNGNTYKLIGSAIPIGNGYGIMGKKDQETLFANINRALLGMEADGAYLNIYSRYFS